MPEQIYSAVRDIVMMVAAVLVFYWGRDRKQVADAIETRFKFQDEKIGALLHQLDVARQRASDHSDKVLVKVADLSERLARLEGRP